MQRRTATGNHDDFKSKTRCLLKDCKRGRRVGSIDIKKEFDAVLLVLLDDNFDAKSIYEAQREAVVSALEELDPGGRVSKARNERGSMSVEKFKSIGYRRWARDIAI